MKIPPTIVGTVMAALAAPVALGHHTFAMFDASQRLTLHGTVKELQWTNPHCFLQLLVRKEGDMQEWSLQMNAPLDLYRNGWRPGSLKPGDKITVVIDPTRDGSHSGRLRSGTAPDGKALPAS
jgi:uncharacterized protein DUF6152